jgi:hypothetical protein
LNLNHTLFSTMNTRRLLLAATLVVATLSAIAQTTPQASGAWARPTVAGQSAGGGFVTITGGSAPDRLLAARAEVSTSVELHEMKMEGSTMRMREVAGIDIPAGQTVKLEPGGLHVMFIGLKAPLANGSSFPLTLRFEKAGDVTVQMQVKPRP